MRGCEDDEEVGVGCVVVIVEVDAVVGVSVETGVKGGVCMAGCRGGFNQ